MNTFWRYLSQTHIKKGEARKSFNFFATSFANFHSLRRTYIEYGSRFFLKITKLFRNVFLFWYDIKLIKNINKYYSNSTNKNLT